METGQLRKITGYSLITAVLYNMGILSPFFAVPLQCSAESSRKRFMGSALVSAVMILAFRAMMLRPLGALGFIWLDGFVLLLVTTGLYICNFEMKGVVLPVRIAAATGVTAVISLLALNFSEGYKEQIILSLNQLLNIGSELNIAGSEILLDGETLFLLFQDIIGNSGLVWYFFFIAFSLWFGKNIMKQRGTENPEGESGSWELPESWVWFLFLPLTLFLLNRLMEIRGIELLGRYASYGVSNIVLISSGCYAIRGLGMIRRYMNIKGMSLQMQRLLLMCMGFLIVMPGVNLALLILTAGIGVSELWVNYRIFDKE